MNKKINKNLNIIEFSSFVLSLLFMGIYLMPNNVIIVKPLTFILGTIFGFTFISIELFLLLVMNNKYRIIDITYILLSIILGVIININIPYSAFLVLVISSLVKAILRNVLVDKIYVGSRYKRYSKIFSTELKSINTNLNKVLNRNKVKVTNKGKSTSKGYAQKDLV